MLDSILEWAVVSMLSLRQKSFHVVRGKYLSLVFVYYRRPGPPFRPNLLNGYFKNFASRINLLVLLNNNTNKVNEYIPLSGHQGSLKVPM